MNGDGGLLRLLAWGLVYAVLLLGHAGLTRAVRGRRQPHAPVGSLPAWPGWARGVGLALALAAGAMIPLAPDVAWPGGRLAFHLWGDVDAALLLVLALQWAATLLLSLAAPPSRWGWDGEAAARIAGRLGVRAVLVGLLVFSLLFTRGALGDNAIRLTDWASARGVWLGVIQPFAFLMWLLAAAPPRYDACGRLLSGGRVLALNHALLTGLFFLGGWSGPFVQIWPWLGGLYLAIKAGLVAACLTWLQAAWLPMVLEHQAGVVWRVVVPVALANLAVTGLVLVLI